MMGKKERRWGDGGRNSREDRGGRKRRRAGGGIIAYIHPENSSKMIRARADYEKRVLRLET